jgi:hypothetical protein
VKLRGVALAMALAWPLAAPAADPAETRDRLMAVMAANADDPAALGHAVRAFLGGLDREDAFRAQADVLRWARTNGVLSRLQFSREMLALNGQYAPDDDLTADYWRHSIMISAKLERGEIKQEEFDYLEGRKLAETRRLQRAEEARWAAAQQAPRPAAAPVAPDGIGAALLGIGRAMKPAPSSSTNCIRTGEVVNCTTR